MFKATSAFLTAVKNARELSFVIGIAFEKLHLLPRMKNGDPAVFIRKMEFLATKSLVQLFLPFLILGLNRLITNSNIFFFKMHSVSAHYYKASL